jgi:hypothetical protein
METAHRNGYNQEQPNFYYSVTSSKSATTVYNRIRDTVGNNCKLVHNRIRDTVAPFLVTVTIGLYGYCDVFDRRPSLLCYTLVVTR